MSRGGAVLTLVAFLLACCARGCEGFATAGASLSTSLAEGVTDKYKRLQNQSDIRGICLPGVEGEVVNLTDLEAFCIGKAFGQWILDRSKGSSAIVGVGRDCRLSGPSLSSSLLNGLSACDGVSVADFGLCTTPACSVSCVSEGYSYSGAIMVTASHLPFNRNGFKFFTSDGGLTKEDISQIVALAALAHVESSGGEDLPAPECRAAQVDFLSVYSDQLKSLIIERVDKQGFARSRPLEGLKVVLNAGNGMGGFLKPLLEELGADASSSLYLEPDGTFPNHLANPELPEAMDVTIAAVKDSGADIGIVLDTDVDRSGIVDSSGRAINRNKLIALVASMVLREHPGTTIVTDSCTSTGLKAFIQRRGGSHLRYKKGYANVIGKAAELNAEEVDCQLAMETSGHGAFKENRLLDDGAYTAMKVLIELARSGPSAMNDALADLVEPVESTEFRLRVKHGGETSDVFEETLARLRAAVDRIDAWEFDEPNYEGLRVTTPYGWLMNRMSLHGKLLFPADCVQSWLRLMIIVLTSLAAPPRPHCHIQRRE
jgi:phosphomannomutase